jgi:hypothetical protein
MVHIWEYSRNPSGWTCLNCEACHNDCWGTLPPLRECPVDMNAEIDHVWSEESRLGIVITWRCAKCQATTERAEKDGGPKAWCYVVDRDQRHWMTCTEKRLESIKAVLEE